jgi:hypothetical protein
MRKASLLKISAIAGIMTLAWCWSAAASISAPFRADAGSVVLGSLPGLGVLVVLVERSTEVAINAVRTEASSLESRKTLLEKGQRNSEPEYVDITAKLEKYKAGTQQLSLLIGLALGVLVACTGVGMLNSILTDKLIPEELQLRRLADIILTAGVLAGGSQAFHENIANPIYKAIQSGAPKPT